MEAYVIHDPLGSIVSLAFVEADPKLSLRPLAPAGFAVTRITLPTKVKPDNVAAVESLIRQYRVDPATGQLAKSKASSSKRR